MKLFMMIILKQYNYFQHNFGLLFYKNESQNIPSEFKAALKKGFGTKVVCTSVYDTHR